MACNRINTPLLPLIGTLYINTNVRSVIEPKVFNRARCIEIINRLQSHTRPDIFHPPAIYDGKNIMYAARVPLRLPGGNSGNVSMQAAICLRVTDS